MLGSWVVEEEEGGGAVREKVRRTRGDSSASTERARKAAEASRAVGRGMDKVLLRGRGLVGGVR